jgi:gliding motility-associated-like protein
MKSYQLLLFTLSLLFVSKSSFAQCDVGVDAGTDILVCPDQNTVRLSGFVNGNNVIDFVWSPATDLSDPTSLIPLVFLSGPVTYTLTVTGFDPADNIIVNGDFSAGDSDFTTEYDPASGGVFGPLSDEGEYIIDDNSSDTHNNFGNCDDHTGGGDMMVVNGSDIAGQQVWCQSVNVNAGTDYVFNAWAMTVVNDNNDAQLQFSINGGLLGSVFPVNGALCSWLQFNSPWTATSTGPVEICIVNQNTAVGGNDFAIDDLFFGEVCEATDEVIIDFLQLEATAPSPLELPCDGMLEIDASGSTAGGDIFYNWTTTDGTIVSGNGTAIINVNAPGTYTFEVVFDDGVNFCSEETTVVVTDDEAMAVAVATTPNRVDCITPEFEISGIGSSIGPNWTYSWTTPDGNIVSGANTLNPLINAGGTYEIVVFNTVSNCTAIEVILVQEDLDPPFADIAQGVAITCGAPGINLNGTLSDSGNGFSFEWTTTDGDIQSGQDGLMPFITLPGTYQLVIGRDENGCTDTATVVVTQEPNSLMATIATPDTLTCTPTPVLLNGNGSSTGGNVEYEWMTVDGMIVSGGTTLTPEVGAPGDYILTVRDMDTGCFTQDTIEVISDTVPPTLALAIPDSITCVRDTAILVATTNGSPNLTYTWSTNDGTIQSGQGNDSLIVSTVGSYFLTIQNTATGCAQTDTVEVGELVTPPLADAGEPVSFTCGTNMATLNGGNSSLGDEFVYSWSTNDGNIVSGGDSLIPIINTIGEYFLEVTNSLTGCFSRDTVVIVSNDEAPPVSIAAVGDLNCLNSFQDLNAVGSASGAGFTFEWTTVGGNFVSGQNSLMPRIDAQGTYTLTVTDTINNCTGVRSVTIGEDTTLPTLALGNDFRLDCNQPTDTLSAAGSDLGPGFDFNWTTNDGNFVGDATIANPTVDSAGLYYFEITNTANGCTMLDSVLVTESFAMPTASVGPAGTITCDDPTLTLGTEVFANDLVYTWTSTIGNITAGADSTQATVNASGTYVFLAVNPDNGCMATDSVVIAESTALPLVIIAPPAELNCDIGTFNLDAGGSSTGNPFMTNWSTANGNISTGGTTLSPAINAPGTYTLIIDNTDNGCVDSSAVTVMGDVVFPVVEAGDSLFVNCRIDEATLDPSGSDMGENFTFAWSTVDGSFVGDPTVAGPTVDSAGVYILTIRNEDNGCVMRDSVFVTESFVTPTASVGPVGTITCNDPTLTLGTEVFANDLVYTWTSAIGNITAGADSTQATVNASGTYVFLAVNPDNGCMATDSVVIAESTALPLVVIAPPGEFNCSIEAFSLDAGGSSTGNPFTTNWSTADGSITTGGTTLSPAINAQGTYTLIIENTDNGCVDSSAVTVMGDVVFPVVEAGDSLFVDCRFDEATLNPSGSDMGGNFTFAWSTDGGSFVGDPTVAGPTVDSAGVYVLTIRNEDNDCVSSDSVVVVQDFATPDVSAGPNRSITCTNPTLDLGQDFLTPGYQYFWITFSGNVIAGDNGPVATVNRPGNYSLRVIDFSNGCASVDNVTVGLDTMSPVANIAPPVELNCMLEETNLAGTAGTDVTYSWTTTDGSISGADYMAAATAIAPGSYSLEVIDTTNGCRAVATATVLQNIAPPVFNIAPAAALTCSTTALGLNADSLGTGFNYAWTSTDGGFVGNTNDPTPTINAPGTYVLEITDGQNFCTNTDSVTVTSNTVEPVPTVAMAEDLNCRTEAVALSGGSDVDPVDAVIGWTTVNGVLSGNIDDLSATATAPGTYTLTIQRNDNGCSAAISVTVGQDITEPTVNLAAAVDLGCFDAPRAIAVAASGSGALTYVWSTSDGVILNNGNTSTPQVQGVGTYSVMVTDQGNGCVASASVLAEQSLLTEFDFTERPPSCERSEGTIVFGSISGGTAPYTYSVDGGSYFQNDPVFQGLVPDTYVLVIRDANGCELEDGTTLVSAPDFELVVSPNALIDFGDSYQINTQINFAESEVDTIIWTPALGLDCADCLRPIARPQETQGYQIRVTTVDGCSAVGFLTIIVNEENPVYFPTAFSPNDDGINDFFVPFGDLDVVARITSMSLFDRWGESVFFNEDFAPNDLFSGWDGKLNGQPMNPQVLVYSVEVEYVNGDKRLFKGDVTLLR